MDVEHSPASTNTEAGISAVVSLAPTSPLQSPAVDRSNLSGEVGTLGEAVQKAGARDGQAGQARNKGGGQDGSQRAGGRGAGTSGQISQPQKGQEKPEGGFTSYKRGFEGGG